MFCMFDRSFYSYSDFVEKVFSTLFCIGQLFASVVSTALFYFHISLLERGFQTTRLDVQLPSFNETYMTLDLV